MKQSCVNIMLHTTGYHHLRKWRNCLCLRIKRCFVDYDKMAGYFGHVGGHVPPYTVSNHGLNHPAPNIDFFNPMAPPSCECWQPLRLQQGKLEVFGAMT
ncbi:hypothetical protein P5673_024224 [Acropora cervicornis]|uniref:Uncharacterized protein n=1 Tax=Acropora cervicornis TaxID=6130 RepID=A0AAD9Q3T0_ACRCE|nr:hypothetical protein P5673_024224 [Acropora cervicornis]